MFPNLFDSTKEYWRKLDELEADYQQNKISLKEVDVRVAELMAELAQERRAAFNYLINGSQHWLGEQREILITLAMLVLLTYAWFLTSLNNL